MPNLSVVVIAKDEERTIGDVLRAVAGLAQEIVLVDSGSCDRTKEIALSCGAKVLEQDWLGYSAQKNFAIDQASSEWILSLDADEIVTPSLAAEILQVLQEVGGWDGFKVARLLFIGDRAVKYGGFYPDTQLRLFRRGKGRFNGRLVHESIKLEGRVRTLNNHLLHRAYKDVEQFRAALDKYAKLSAEESLRSGYNPAKVSLLNEIFHPLWTFFYRYFIRCGFLDGMLGFELNLIYSDYVRKKIVYLKQAIQER